ncbi:beta-lactamase family protein [Streptomyces sp. NBC_00365]|uniref:serine hydrolase domain-containing protein n=1 Tax=Streptomyces sp. NBC_00365 TaxID=2975726 RepID=UPI00224CD75C|nr:serine hydrolase domain-containing protein [Streptomyces sp. NBC_00365]MCX5087392.1 beta-lactamase family protein [Streptomyces sp. NBC_00365]MCX5096241.1 beta-lactamase family protein [Streptomyces sp. NBC_00365]MCX5097968.1 beta-lactamase family protein [Streptomyces sp. NBC_00365]
MTHACGRLRRGAVTATAVGMLTVPVTGPAASGAPVSVRTAATVPQPPPSTAPQPPSPSASPAGGVRTLTPAVTRQLDGTVRQVMREANVPGVSVGLWTPGRGTYIRSFGVADKSDGRPMSPDLYMRIGSETKTFTVTALLKLVDEGKAGLDDPIGRYVAGVPGGDRITLRELAGMRSGLFNYTEDPGFFKAFTSDPQRPFTPRQLLAYAFKHPVLFPPGQKFSYCNTNLILLGLAVEKAGGKPVQDYIHDSVLAPAGLRHTLFPTGAAFPGPHAQGYTDQTATGKVEDTAGWNPSWAWTAGAMISDLDDLRVWARTVATGVLPDGTTLISPATQKQRLTTLPTTVPGAGYGLGIFDVQGWIGHNGSLPGYESLTVYLPAAQATLVVLLNTDIDHNGAEPSTLFGEAITKIVSPGHVFSLPAQPAAR